MKKVLAFFGAFNPPTNAHINLAEFAMKETGSEGVVFIPSKGDYIIDEQKKEYAFEDSFRLDMLNDIKINRPWMDVCDHDTKSETQPRTYETLCWLKEQDVEPTLLIGSDVLFKMEKEWVNVDKIAQEFGIVCMTRWNSEKDAQKDPFISSLLPYITFIESPKEYEHISSTSVRNECDASLKHWTNVCYAVPPEVAAHLLKDFADVFLGGHHDI